MVYFDRESSKWSKYISCKRTQKRIKALGEQVGVFVTGDPQTCKISNYITRVDLCHDETRSATYMRRNKIGFSIEVKLSRSNGAWVSRNILDF